MKVGEKKTRNVKLMEVEIIPHVKDEEHKKYVYLKIFIVPSSFFPISHFQATFLDFNYYLADFALAHSGRHPYLTQGVKLFFFW